MGYTTELEGTFRIQPALTTRDREALNAFIRSREEVGAPSRHCEWEVSRSGDALAWNGTEKFVAYAEWLHLLVSELFAPRGYSLSGEVRWRGEEPGDEGVLRAHGTQVTTERLGAVFDLSSAITRLRSIDRTMRHGALLELSELLWQTPSPELLALYAEGLKDPDIELRCEVAGVIGTLMLPGSSSGYVEADVAPLLLAAAEDGNDRVRAEVAAALEHIGSATAALERLAAEDPSARVRGAAAHALARRRARSGANARA